MRRTYTRDQGLCRPDKSDCEVKTTLRYRFGFCRPPQWVVQVVQRTMARRQGGPYDGPTVEAVFCFPIQNVVKSTEIYGVT